MEQLHETKYRLRLQRGTARDPAEQVILEAMRQSPLRGWGFRHLHVFKSGLIVPFISAPRHGYIIWLIDSKEQLMPRRYKKHRIINLSRKFVLLCPDIGVWLHIKITRLQIQKIGAMPYRFPPLREAIDEEILERLKWDGVVNENQYLTSDGTLRVKIHMHNLEQQDYADYDCMRRDEWNNNVVDAPSTHFDTLINKYRGLFDWRDLEEGDFYYSSWAIPNRLYFKPAFAQLYQNNKYYCLASSFEHIIELLDPSVYINNVEYNKALRSLEKLQLYFNVAGRFVSLSWQLTVNDKEQSFI